MPLPFLTSGLEPLPLDVVAGPRLRVDHVEAALPGGPVGHPPDDAVGVEHLVGAGDDALLVGGLVAGVRQPRVLVVDGVGEGVGLPHGGLQNREIDDRRFSLILGMGHSIQLYNGPCT